MTGRPRLPFLLVAAAFAAAAFPLARARAADLPSAQDIDAISHTLGFVDGIPHAGKIRIGVVYDGSTETGRSDAAKVADAVAAAAGPGTTQLAAVAIAAADIGGAADVDALLLMPRLNAFTRDIVDAAARRHLPTISTDPGCIEQQLCVLWVQAEPRVSVTLNTQLAEALSVHISPIFAMMVTRK
jgi:hypothetical protein